MLVILASMRQTDFTFEQLQGYVEDLRRPICATFGGRCGGSEGKYGASLSQRSHPLLGTILKRMKAEREKRQPPPTFVLFGDCVSG